MIFATNNGEIIVNVINVTNGRANVMIVLILDDVIDNCTGYVFIVGSYAVVRV